MLCNSPPSARNLRVQCDPNSPKWRSVGYDEVVVQLLGENRHPVWELVCRRPAEVLLLVRHGDVLHDSTAICELRSALNGVEANVLGLWMSTHAAIRGVQAAQGEGGQIAARVTPVEGRIERGAALSEIAALLPALRDGDVVCISEKAAALSQGRVGRQDLLEADPKFLDMDARARLAARLQEQLGFAVSNYHLMLIDHLPDGEMTVGTMDPNGFCRDLAKLIRETGAIVDVVLVDSDTGVDLCQPLTGLPTIGSSPVGATAGVTYYECLRASAAAEYARGHNRGTPIIIVHPSERNRSRAAVGAYRGYEGALNVSMEPLLHHGIACPMHWRKASQ